MEAHRNLQKEHDSLKTNFTDSEKKFQRKLSEMKEIQQLDQQAKVHMEDSFRLSLEEKDEKINVMQMQVEHCTSVQACVGGGGHICGGGRGKFVLGGMCVCVCGICGDCVYVTVCVWQVSDVCVCVRVIMSHFGKYI